MEICSISDIHGEFINIPACDILCICGDIVGLNDQRSMDASRHWWYNRFTNWVNRLPCNKVIATPGNHDFYIEHAYKNGYFNELKKDLSVRTNGKLELLINEEYNYDGLKFYGCPYIRPIPFQEGRWAFEDNYKSLGDLETCYDIPKGIDILLTHDNPFKNLVLGSKIDSTNMPQYHFYGHWHDGPSFLDGYNCYNCSILDDMYNRKKNYEITKVNVMTNKEYLALLITNFTVFYKLKGEKDLTLGDMHEFFGMQEAVLDLPFMGEDETPLPVSGEVLEPECVNYEEDED